MAGAELTLTCAEPQPTVRRATTAPDGRAVLRLVGAGQVSLGDVLGETGIAAEVVWDDVIPAALLGMDEWPGEERLRQLVRRHRSVSSRPDEWRLYLLLVPRIRADLELSLLVEPCDRSAALVQVDPGAPPGESLHAILHEIGHLLNLPHPWEVYGNTRSVMSYPWRWRDWDWADPRVFHFDPVARRHILRAPETIVRPGASGFLEYLDAE